MDDAPIGNRPADWNPGEPGTLEERMRRQSETRERCPVAWADFHGGTWSVLRYADITRVALDTETFSNAARPRYGVSLPPLEVDPPQHRTYRKALQPFFTPERAKTIEAQIRPQAVAIIERLVARGAADLARDLAYPVPAFGLCALIGAPASDWGDIKAWSENTLLMDSSDARDRALAAQSHESLMSYSRAMVADRRRAPRDPADDLTSALMATSVDGTLVDDETTAKTLRLLFSAGHNSTTSGLGNALVHLAENQADQETLRADPAMLTTAVEEFLRLYTPVQEMPRVATRDVELGGRDVRKGERLGLFWSSANRDPAAFAEPETCRLDRTPNRHIAFGHGIHTCLGSPMARMEMRLVLAELLARTRRFEIAGPIKRPPFHRIGVDSLPARLFK